MAEEKFTSSALTLSRAAMSLGNVTVDDIVEEKKKCVLELLKLHILRRLFLISFVDGTIAFILSYYDLESMFNSISLALFGVSFCCPARPTINYEQGKLYLLLTFS